MELKGKLEEDLKKRDINPKSIGKIFEYSINGIMCYAKEGKSIILYLVCAVVEIFWGFVFKINGLEWILLICIFGIILSVELINTAIENICDLITTEYNPLVKIAKDCGSAATFSMFIVAIILNIIIFAPKIYALFI